MGSCPQNCKIFCFENSQIVKGLPVQIYDNIDNKYINQPNYSSLIFLQIKIKKYLRHKKSLSNSNLVKLKAINTLKSNSSSNNNIVDNKVPKILNYNVTNKFNANFMRKTTDKEDRNESQKSINKKLAEINQQKLYFPKLILSKGPNLFKKDLFPNTISPKKYLNDNKRRKFPLLIQGDFSYEGEWKNGKRDGLGIYIKKNAAKFIGYFIEDYVNGFGKLTDGNGDEYIGYWIKSMANGIGIYSRKRIISYKGWWKDDKQNKFGIEVWPKLDFIGDYSNGVKEGYGIMNIKDGIYEGEMKGGNFNGIGKFMFNDKRRYEGEFKNNKMDGFGILYLPGNKIFVGHFKDDLQDGFGVFYTNKRIYVGFWQNMLLEGKVIIVEGNKRKKQIWEEGRLRKNLASNYKIFFEKYIEDIINEKNIFISDKLGYI